MEIHIQGTRNVSTCAWGYIILFLTCLYRCRHTPGLELPSEGPLLEHVSLNLIHEAIVPGGANVMCPVSGQIMIATGDGHIRRINWSGIFDSQLTIYLNNLPFANDCLPETRG